MTDSFSFLTVNFIIKLNRVAMGSPLAPVLANIFMDLYKSKWLNEHYLKKSKFYWRCVDNILAAFDSEQGSSNFKKISYNKHHLQ